MKYFGAFLMAFPFILVFGMGTWLTGWRMLVVIAGVAATLACMYGGAYLITGGK